MVHVRIVSLSLDSVTKQPVVILRPVDDHSDAGRFITGTTIVIDGGATIGGEA